MLNVDLQGLDSPMATSAAEVAYDREPRRNLP